MLCQRCHKREAVVKFTQVMGDEKNSINLCNECADKQGISNPVSDVSKMFGKIIVAILSEHLAKTTSTKTAADSKLQCSHCGLKWTDFKETNRLGCENCYETFVDPLKILLRRVHGNNRHIGPSVKESGKQKETNLQELRLKLELAVKNEEYEIAAELRDRIREIKRNSK